jgi:hypothetical protein
MEQEMAERDESGRFRKGISGNPKGRPPKERELRFYEITLQAVTFDDWKEIVKKAVQQAKRGDAQARKWLADYLMGPPVQRNELAGPNGGSINILWDLLTPKSE